MMMDSSVDENTMADGTATIKVLEELEQTQ